MRQGFYINILLAILLAFSVGCTKKETRVDRFHGTSYELSKQSQINNPNAGIKDGPSVGLTGNVATKVIERYEKGFEQPPPKNKTYSVDVDGVIIK